MIGAARRGLATALIATALAACGGDGERRGRGEGALSGLGGGGNKSEETGGAEPAPAAASPAAPSAGGIDGTRQPERGTAQRAAIMDALRPAIERELGGPIEFVVQRAAVQDGWALVIAEPQRPGGGAITPPSGFDTEFRDGLTVNGILRFTGRGWTLVDHAIGPTDVWYCGVEGPPSALTGC